MRAPVPGAFVRGFRRAPLEPSPLSVAGILGGAARLSRALSDALSFRAGFWGFARALGVDLALSPRRGRLVFGLAGGSKFVGGLGGGAPPAGFGDFAALRSPGPDRLGPRRARAGGALVLGLVGPRLGARDRDRPVRLHRGGVLFGPAFAPWERGARCRSLGVPHGGGRIPGVVVRQCLDFSPPPAEGAGAFFAGFWRGPPRGPASEGRPAPGRPLAGSELDRPGLALPRSLSRSRTIRSIGSSAASTASPEISGKRGFARARGLASALVRRLILLDQ